MPYPCDAAHAPFIFLPILLFPSLTYPLQKRLRVSLVQTWVTKAPSWSKAWRRGPVRRGDVGPLFRGLTTCGRGQRGWVPRVLGGSGRQIPWLALGTWNVTSLKAKEPELVPKDEKSRVDIGSLTLTHGKGSGTSLLERCRTLVHSGVADSERQRAGVVIFLAPRLSACTLEYTPVKKKVASLRLRLRGRILNVSSGYLPILESLECSFWGFPRPPG